ncbi:hypothetical protein RAS1_19530 [Phycisphaerae bacterium RAS1]|nr:hypothetical protein RAS1_19530 [Phycisphaerae bacterium RAS1]
MTKKWMAMSALLFGGATLFQGGCLGSFFDGFFNGGFPNQPRWLNIGLDVLQEELFG